MILCAGLLSLPADGAVFSWSGAGSPDGNWSNAANWGFTGVPGNGDIVIFPAVQPNQLNTNNLVGLTLNQIKFVGAGGGYDIRGNDFTLTNNIQATNTAGANLIENNIKLANVDQIINVATSLTLEGNLSGTVGVTKTGAGALTYFGIANSYSGTTRVNTGTLMLNCDDLDAAFGGPLIISDGSSTATVQLVIDRELPNNQPITINAGGLLDLNSQDDNISGSLTLVNSGSVNVGTAPLTLLAPSTITVNGGACAINGSGSVVLGAGPCVINVTSGILSVNPSIQGTAAITKTGNGSLEFLGANTYSGLTTISQGWLYALNSMALGLTNNGTVVSNGATLVLEGNITVTNEALTLNGPGNPSWAALDCEQADTNNWTGPIFLATDSTVGEYNTAGRLRLSGVISGPGGLTEVYTGTGNTVSLEGPTVNTYGGTTFVSGGTLALGKPFAIVAVPGPLIIGSNATVRLLNSFQIDNPATPLTMGESSLLDLAGFNEWVGPTSLHGSQITAGAGTFYFSSNITVNPSLISQSIISGNASIWNGTYVITNTGNYFSPDLVISANLTSGGGGSGGLTKDGDGEASLAGTNSFLGPVTVNRGSLWARTSTALGNTNTPATINNTGTLFLDGIGLDFGLKPLVLNGLGYASGALTCNGSSSWSGGVALATDSQIDTYSASTLTLAGPITGAGALAKIDSGILTLSGSVSNTYTGLTTVNGGTLNLNKSTFDGAIPSDLTINGGAVVRLLLNNQIDNMANVTINGSGLLDLNTAFDGIGTLNGNGNLALGALFLDLFGNTTYTFNGLISGAGFIQNQALGTAIFNGNNTYLGKTAVNAGKIVINGSQPQSPVTIAAGATLGGSGTVGTITANGTISPGNSPGILNSSNVTFSATGHFTVELDGPNPGTGYDQLNVTGTNTLANATLTIVPAFTTPVTVGQTFTILNNDGAEAITGTFNGLPGGSTIAVGGYTFTIVYAGTFGNDVVLTLTSIPGATVSSTVTAGDGSHGIDPNGCNNLALVFTNTTASPMTGIAATLSTTTEGVLITQPYASYPNIPAHGNGTNLAPFQISTLPSFVCGTPINLQLSVDSSLGSFTMPFVQSTGESAAPTRFDNNTTTNVPDVGGADSTNTVAAWTGGGITKVTVSLWLSAPLDSDLSLSLIAPNGTNVSLAIGAGGSNPNFGTGNADASRTTFDDAAATAIAGGAAPFTGSFRPQSPLSALIGTSPNGAWHLHIQDGGFSGNPDTLRAWSLFLSGTGCSTGSGACDYCLTSISGSIINTDLLQTNRVTRTGVVASCGAPKPWPGPNDTLARHYDVYTFTNTSAADACVTVLLVSPGDLQAVVYLNAFDPSNLSNNYVADSGNSTAGNIPQSCSASIPPGATFLVAVDEITPNIGGNYTLQLSGLPCPPPTLTVQPVPAGKARLYWPTWAGGYLLEATPSLYPTNWAYITNEPIVAALQYNVTNAISSSTNRFYRLHKP